jgi:hypothetical protein
MGWLIKPKKTQTPVCPLCDKFVGLDSIIMHMAAHHGSDDLKARLGYQFIVTLKCLCGEEFQGTPWEAMDDVCRHMQALANFGLIEDHRLVDLMGGKISCREMGWPTIGGKCGASISDYLFWHSSQPAV